MKKFLNVLSFELTNYFKNKGYMITTILISAILIIGLSLPSLFDLSGLIPGLSKNNATVEENQGEDSGIIDSDSDEENVNYVIFDKSGLIADDNFELIKSYFPNANFEKVTSVNDITDDGLYLIVYENGEKAYAFDSSLATLDATNNYKELALSALGIAVDDTSNSVTFRITKNSDGTFAILSASSHIDLG